MPQISVNSATITTFGWSADWDIYNRAVTFNLLPFTTGPNLAGRPVCFSVIDQDGVTLASVNFTTPQIASAGATTSWVLDLSNVNFPFLFQTYKIFASIQDSGGLIYSTVPIYANICQPTSLTDQGYVPGVFQISPDCINNVLTVQEITLLVYNSLQPQSITKSGNLYYPIGTISAVAFANTPFSNNVVYTGQYNVTCTTVATYNIGQDCYVLVSYLTNNNFQVTCANKMADILCCIQKVEQTYLQNCNNAIGANAKQQLSDISLFVMNGLLKEISGQDSQFEVDYIKKYLGCNCGSASLSQSEFTPINPAVTSIVLNGVGGTTITAPAITGNTKTYNIGSNVYQVVKGNTGDLAFTIQLNTAISNTVQYIITFNYDTMAGYILTAIQNDPTLLSQLNSLVTAAGSILGLNGICVINTSQVNYSLSQAITGSTLLVNVVINGTIYAAPANLFGNNPTAVAAWLNSLTLGTFSAGVTSGILTILSVNNTNVAATMTFNSPNVTQAFQATSVTLVQVLQAIINFLCNLTALQVALGNAVTLCTLDYNNNIVETTYQGSTTQQAYNGALTNAICNIVTRINSLVAFTCAKLQALFQDNTGATFNNATDRYLSIVGGSCITLTGHQQALALIAAIQTYPDALAAFCAISCTTPATCPNISNASFSALNPTTIGFYGVTWGVIPSANQIVTLQYRQTGSIPWITASGGINLTPAGTISGTTPFQITALTPGTVYQVQVQNNCGGAAFITTVTVPANTTFNGPFRLDNVIYNICGETPVVLYSAAPFAVGVTMFTDPGLTMPQTGYTLIAPGSGEIYNLDTSTGVVGSDTLSNCGTGTPGIYLLANSSGAVCTAASKTLYTNGVFAVGSILYTDQSLTNPQTGFTFVVPTANSNIYNMNSSTGQVPSATGSSCTAIGNSVQLAGSVNSICQASPTTAYTNGAFATGKILYSDAGLTTPITGYLFVVNSNTLYNLNSGTGVIGSVTGQTCSDLIINNGSSWATVTGTNLITGFTLTGTVAPAGSQNGTHGAFTNTPQITITGSVSGSTKAQLLKNGVEVSCVALTGAGTYTFSNQTYNIGDQLTIRMTGGICP